VLQKVQEYNKQCPLCRTPGPKSDAETLRQLQGHVDKGNATAQYNLGNAYLHGVLGLKKSFKRALQLQTLSAV